MIKNVGFRLKKRKGPTISSPSKLSKYILRKAKTYYFIGQYFSKKTIFRAAKLFPIISQWYTKHFPAVRLNHTLSPLEYGLNFSSEILVGIFVVVVAVTNIVVFNPFSSKLAHSDNSLAAEFLRNHTALNSQLALQHNTITTSVTDQNGLINQAFADQQTGSVLSATDTIDLANSSDGIDDNGISKANPDSIRKLVSRQVQIYETKPFDTVYTVAKQFNVTPKTIRDTNGLSDNSLKAGWFLVVPPVDGIVLEVANADLSLDDIATKYRANLDQIVSYNGLEGPDSELTVGDYLIIPGGRLPDAPAPTPAPTPKNNPKPTTIRPSIPRATFTGSNKFARGQCTDYAAQHAHVYWRGNAKEWARNAAAAGASVNMTPTVGAIIQTNESWYGHVGVVESVSNGEVTFGEWNRIGPFKYSRTTISVNDKRIKAFIHP